MKEDKEKKYVAELKKMFDEKRKEKSEENYFKLYLIDPMIVRSLNRSDLRRKILFYLYKIYPNVAYLSEIAKAVKSDPSNVLGCLKGMGERYRDNFSLISLGLVEVVKIGNYKYYRLTEYGKKVVEHCIDYYITV